MNRVLLIFGMAVVLALTGLFCWQEGSRYAFTAGREQGRYEGQQAVQLGLLADSCDDVGKAYDASSEAEKAAKGVPSKWDNRVCEKFHQVAAAYLKG